MSQQNNNSCSYNDLKCIWMNSDTIEYKLCDMNFECENCAFDKGMRVRNQEMAYNEIIPKIKQDILHEKTSMILSEKYETKVIYIKNQLILKHLFANTYYAGLNPFLLDMLDNVTEICSSESTYIKKDQKLLDLFGSWGKVSIISPVDLLMLERISVLPDEMKQKRWFAIVGVHPQEITLNRLNATEWKEEQKRIVELLNSYKVDKPEVGVTMLDGGTAVVSLAQYLGPKEYEELLKNILYKK